MSTRRRTLALLLAGGAGALATRGRAAAAPLCEPTARETAGPFPADGSQRRGGVPIDALANPALFRADIRPSTTGRRAIAAGLPFELRITLVDATSGCPALANRAIYIWHADRDGDYSMYGGKANAEDYLRGVQLTGSDGVARFRSVFPSCYGGRWPHIHFSVYADRASARAGSTPLLVSQIAMPQRESAAVYARAPGYERSGTNLAQSSLARDGVFRDNTPRQIAAMTARLQGDPDKGFDAEVTIAI